jgi:hypothetical protein
MNALTIERNDQTMEILAKIANSLVKKYDCGVKFDNDNGQIFITGEDNCTAIVAEEVRDFLEQK